MTPDTNSPDHLFFPVEITATDENHHVPHCSSAPYIIAARNLYRVSVLRRNQRGIARHLGFCPQATNEIR
jgi:hypothetical protein